MAFAFGQNATELGRNIIDLEGLRNSRDAAQAQAQNQFLAQLNQAALARQQMGQQSQQQDKALMFQALQQRAQQDQQNRDFGLRQNAQNIQDEQFRKGLELQRGQLEYARAAGSPKLAEGIFGANIDTAGQNRTAAGVADALNEVLAAEHRRYTAKKNETSAKWVSGNPFRSDRPVLEQNDAKEHDDIVAGILAKAQPFMGALKIVHNPSDPSQISLVPNPAPMFQLPGRGGETDTGENSPLPRTIPVSQSGPTVISPIPMPAAQQSVPVSKTTSSWNFDKASWLKKLFGSQAPVVNPALQKAINSGLIPMVSPDGQIKIPPIADAQDWMKNGWKVHPDAIPLIPQITNEQASPFVDPSAGITNSPANTWMSPIPSY